MGEAVRAKGPHRCPPQGVWGDDVLLSSTSNGQAGKAGPDVPHSNLNAINYFI